MERFPKTSSEWANPFKVGKVGKDGVFKGLTREECVEKYEVYIRTKIEKGEVDLEVLRDKVLGCWCKPERCHGDVLINLLNEKKKDNTGSVVNVKVAFIRPKYKNLKEFTDDSNNSYIGRAGVVFVNK
jgi:hypothetical protein